MGRFKRSLSGAGGACRLRGDPLWARRLAECLDVDPNPRLPFTHGFHAYPARMHPETASRALDLFPSGGVFDPFVGSGTTAVECVRRGRPFVGCDISNVALEIAWIRTRVLSPGACRRLEASGHLLAGRAMADRDRSFPWPLWARRERAWYAPHTLGEILRLHAGILQEKDDLIRRILRGVLSSILVRLSRQESDADPRPRRDFRPPPRGAAFRAFRDRCTELSGMLRDLSSDLLRRRVPFVEPQFHRADSRRDLLPAASVGLVLTSPPYAGVYDYAVHQERRYPIFGGGGDFARRCEIGSRRTGGARYREDMESSLGAMLRALAPGGHLLMLVGDGRVAGRPLRADRLVEDLCRGLGARVLASASQARRDWAGGPPRDEHLILVVRD